MKTTNLGMPNVYNALIKKAVEGFWGGRNPPGKNPLESILAAQQQVIDYNATLQQKLDLQPVWDIDIYDRMLRTAVVFGMVPKRFGKAEDAVTDLQIYLSIGRGTPRAQASPMIKWFNTNYHVVQPEIEGEPKLTVDPALFGPVQGKKLALIGPWTLLSYALNKTEHSPTQLFNLLADQYLHLLNSIPPTVVQLEEPSFLTNGLPPGSYGDFVGKIKHIVHLHTYFGAANDLAPWLFRLPVAGLGLDFIDGPENVELLPQFPGDKVLIAGILNGRNVHPVSNRTEQLLRVIREHIPDKQLYISPSCSLQHVPLSADGEQQRFSFAKEKLEELTAIRDGTISYIPSRIAQESLPERVFRRARKEYWVSSTPFPTTTIGSFPQIAAVRENRKLWKQQEKTTEEYEDTVRGLIKDCIRRQEQLGLEVLVHGEFERSDMVEYFAEQLEGFVPIKGAVQSYGTRHVRPPVMVGPVHRRGPMTVKWSTYAQSLTDQPVKGMLTGPVTMVQWSFPREDISREAQYYDVAKALAEEVQDLAHAGIKHLQIDEPALREGLPLDPKKREHYLRHAVNAFRSVYAGVPDNIVVHSHMCFSDFAAIVDAIREMGVDVLSIEDSKAQGRTAESLRKAGFPGSIGLGVFDVHSPRVPTLEEMVKIPQLLLNSGFDPRRIWINPDCGLKTRGEEAYEQVGKMMDVAKVLRGRRLE